MVSLSVTERVGYWTAMSAGRFGVRRQLAIAPLVTTSDQVKPYVVLGHSKSQGQGCRFPSSPPPILVQMAQVSMGHVLSNALMFQAYDRKVITYFALVN